MVQLYLFNMYFLTYFVDCVLKIKSIKFINLKSVYNSIKKQWAKSLSMGCATANSRLFIYFIYNQIFCFPGVFAAAHDLKTEWVVVKGIKDYADGSRSNDEWGTFASVMAASVVANILSDAVIFEDWPHYNPGNASSVIPSLSSFHVHLNKSNCFVLFCFVF